MTKPVKLDAQTVWYQTCLLQIPPFSWIRGQFDYTNTLSKYLWFDSYNVAFNKQQLAIIWTRRQIKYKLGTTFTVSVQYKIN